MVYNYWIYVYIYYIWIQIVYIVYSVVCVFSVFLRFHYERALFFLLTKNTLKTVTVTGNGHRNIQIKKPKRNIT